MITAPINSFVQDTNFAVSTVQKKYNVSETVDFGKHFDKASQSVNNSYENSKENVATKESTKKAPEDENVDIHDDNKTEKVSEKDNDLSKDKVVGDEKTDNVDNEEVALDGKDVEEFNEEVAEILSQIIEQIKSILGISDEEFLSAMENMGIQAVDLFNTDNIPQLIMNIAGEESNISFVANEEMYSSLQDILQVVEDGMRSLMEDNGLTSEEFDKLIQKIKLLDDVNSEEVVENTVDTVILDEVNAENTESINSAKTSLVENEYENTTNVQIKNDGTENAVKTPDVSDEEREEKRDFGQQNSFSNNFENNQNDIAKLTSENSIATYTSENTEKIMRQIVDMVKVVKSEQLTEMELQLHPASLGNVKVNLATKGGVVTAEFITQNEAVKNAIEAQAVQLKANLEEQGVKIEAIEVSVASHQMEKNLEQNNRNNSEKEREQDEKYVQGIRKNNINFNSFEDGEELIDEFNNADDATRIAMEMMAMNGNSMDIMA